MKVIIWILCILVTSAILFLIGSAAYPWGGLAYFATYFIARSLCNKWEYRNMSPKDDYDDYDED